ncbi:MAG: hypothetical protein LBQ59_03255 [Candidatus Peribacteria bacterium]|nr:hypothetical protein [Candidatus Peribacteria bacterium]
MEFICLLVCKILRLCRIQLPELIQIYLVVPTPLKHLAFHINSDLTELSGQVATILNIGQLHNTLSQVTEHLKFLTQKEKHNLTINSTSPIVLRPSTVLSKDTQKLREKKLWGKLRKIQKCRESPPAFREVNNELTGSNDLIIRNPSTSVPPKRPSEDL